MSVNSGLQATKIRIPEFSHARKETVDVDILVTSRNGDRKIMQFIRIMSRPSSRKWTWNQWLLQSTPSEDYILFRKNTSLEITKTAELKNVALLVTKKNMNQVCKIMFKKLSQFCSNAF